jgi:hypothetical protein
MAEAQQPTTNTTNSPAAAGTDAGKNATAAAGIAASGTAAIEAGLAGKPSPAAQQQPRQPSQEQPGATTTAGGDNAAAAADQSTPATLADINRMLDEREQKQQMGAQQKQVRREFMDTRLKNFPEVYRQLLGTDPAKWESEAKTIQARFQEDFKGLGLKVPDVGGETPGGQSPAAAVRPPQLPNGTDAIDQGLRQKQNNRSAPAAR